MNPFYSRFQYFLVVLSLLLVEFTFCSMATVWPQCIGLNLDESVMVKVLQSSYGVPGKEQVISSEVRSLTKIKAISFKYHILQLTASIDLAQTRFKCCAINSNLNYDMSLWRLQSYGQRDWAVPQSCCMLTNTDEERSYLDPKPQNLTLCQSLLKHEYNRARHKDPCIDHLSTFYKQHYFIFLIGGLVVAIVEFIVLVSIVFSCIRMASNRRRKKVMCRSTGTTMQSNVLAHPVKRPAPQPLNQQPLNENVYVTNASNENAMHRNTDPVKIPNAYSYHMSTSYLV